MRYKAVFTPFKLRHVTLKNRIVSTSHAPAYAENGKPTLRYQLYHEEKAKGGLALSMFGGSSVIAPDSPASFGQLDMGSDSVIPTLTEFSERIHRYDCALMVQLAHAGRRTGWDRAHWLPPISSSPVREPENRSFPKQMEIADIRRVIQAYGAAAWRGQQGGLDGCEIIATSHLPGQFLSPLVNRRTDGYGGSHANRTRFAIEVLEEIRRRAGERFIIGVRITMDEVLEGGITEEEALLTARALIATGVVDYLNINVGQSWTPRTLGLSIPGMGSPMAPHVARIGRIRREINFPVMHSARVIDLATAEHAIAEGHVDMIGMTRAHIADPHLIAKAQAGEEARIRPCVGSRYCIDRIYVGKDALCIHNAATGREGVLPHKVPKSTGSRRRVAVVGAGPAGLEAARVAAERGHRVVLFEAAKEPGGQILLAAKVKWRRDHIGIVDWLVHEIRRLGVEERYNTFAEERDVMATEPDAVVIATGGVPNTDVVAGAEHVVSVWDVLSGQVAPGQSVLLYDDNGRDQGPSTAEFLAERGASVELVTPDRMAAHEIGVTNLGVYLNHLYEAGVRMTPNLRLRSVRKEGNALACVLRNEFNDADETRTVDQVVVEHGTLPNDGLYFDLQAGSTNLGQVDYDALIEGRPPIPTTNADGKYVLFRVGDAVASRNIHAAIYDSLRLCKDL